MKNKLATFLALTFFSTLIPQLSTLHAQSTAFTYQGRVRSGGADFNGAGLFKFALVTSTNFNHQATAAANMGGISPNQFVSSCAVNNRGNG